VTSDPRTNLLDRALAHVRANGLGNISLREFAAAIGTSHRMLIYHFGSREGLIRELVRATEERERAALRESVAELGETASARELLARSWTRVSDPEMAPHERLFFELYSHGLSSAGGPSTEVANLVNDWIRAVPPDSAAMARLSIAVLRGLLLDLLATGDREGVDDAFNLFLQMVPTM
jgi:AcrR family transcriptional regulator